MPTPLDRTRTLTQIGLLPEAAQAIVTAADARRGLLLDDTTTSAAATTNATDQVRAQAWVLFTSLVPDWLRRAWSAMTYPPVSL
jgi:hypothetical protein